jgi:hypothetical protein
LHTGNGCDLVDKIVSRDFCFWIIFILLETAIDPYESAHFATRNFLANRLHGGVALLSVCMVMSTGSLRTGCAFIGGTHSERYFSR